MEVEANPPARAEAMNFVDRTRHPFFSIAWMVVFLASLLMLLASIPGYIFGPFGTDSVQGASPEFLAVTHFLSSLASFGGAALSISLAGLLYLRKRSEGIALFISFYLLIYAIIMGGPLEVISSYWGVVEEPILLQTGVLTLPTIIIFSVFPDGKFVPAWTRWLVAAALLINLGVYFRPVEIWLTFADLQAQLLGAMLGLTLLAAMYAQVYRYRKVSGFIARQQTKWVVVGLFLWVLYIGLSSIPWVYLQNLPPGVPHPWWVPVATIGWWISLSIFPLSLAIAILRARLWDIDLLIRRTLSYAILTGLLALVFFGGVVLLQNFFQAFLGQADSPLITVISTLAIAALFNPLRRRVQAFIDRRFFRQKYDAEQTLMRFSTTVRDVVDIENLAVAMLGVVDETMQPERISLWIFGQN